MTKWLIIIGILMILFPTLKNLIKTYLPGKFQSVKSPLVFWTALSGLDLLVCGGLIFGSTSLGLLLIPVILGTILGLVVLMGCLVNWILA